MAKFTQAGRPFTLTTPLGPDALLLVKLTGTEALAEPYRFELELVAEEAVDFDRLLGAEARVSLALPGGRPRYLHGLISRLTEGGRTAGPAGADTFLTYRAELVPALWLLSQRVQSRVFRRGDRLQTSVPDILQQVLRDEWRLKVSFRFTGQYPARDHCVQYRESDLAFISRLMEEEGIYYYFVHDEDGCELVVTDAVSGCRPPGEAIVYQPVRGGKRDEPRIRQWEKTQEVRAVRYTLRDYNFQKPDSTLQAQQSSLVPEQVKVGQVEHRLNRNHAIAGAEMLEVYDYPAGYGQRFDGIGAGGQAHPQELEALATDKDRLVRLRMQEQAAQCLQVRGGSDCSELTPGHLFRLARHPSADGTYLVTRVEHQASQPVGVSSLERVEATYANRFTCVPEELPYRPARTTPRPRIDGTQTATVVGPSGQKTFVDKFGRVKVQFRWDRDGKHNADSSGWVRVSQAWAGYRMGAFFWPRVGHEVVVAFEEGDPDRPVVVGSVYNAQNMPPFELPERVLTTGFKSGSLGGDPLRDFNGLLFHDEPGNENVQLHGEKRTLTSDEHEREVRVGKFQRTIIGGPFVGLPSSGSGGGVVPVDNKTGFDAFESAWSNDLTFAYGHSLLDTNGLSVFSHVGGKVLATLNPIGLVDLWKGDVSKSAAMAASNWKFLTKPASALHDVFGGFCSYTVGANTLANYGPTLMVGHGWTVQNFAPLTGEHKCAYALTIKLLVSAISAAQLTLALGPFLKLGYTWTYIVEGLGGALMAGLMGIEKHDALLQEGEQTRLQGLCIVDQLAALDQAHASPETLRAFANSLKRSVADVEAKIAAGIDNAVLVQTAANAMTVHGRYGLTVHDDITLASSKDKGSTVTIRAGTIRPASPAGPAGNPPAAPAEEIRGELSLVATGTATIRAGMMFPPVFGELAEFTRGDLILSATGTAKLTSTPIDDKGNIYIQNQIVLQDQRPAAHPPLGTLGVNVMSYDGVLLRHFPEGQPGPNDQIDGAVCPTVQVIDQHVKMYSGAKAVDNGPRIDLDSEHGTLTLAVGDKNGPKIVLSTHGIELITTDKSYVKIGGRDAGDRDKIVIRQGARHLTAADKDVTVL